MIQINADASFSHHILTPAKDFPNNLLLPVLLYKQVFSGDINGNAVAELLANNHWQNSWIDSIFTYHHYHSTAHEVLVVLKGSCMLLLGGDNGNIQHIHTGDVIVLPAGVAHKNVGSSADFTCLGAYPDGQLYDIKYGEISERAEADQNIAEVPLPTKDPVFGDSGPLKQFWKHEAGTSDMHEEIQF